MKYHKILPFFFVKRTMDAVQPATRQDLWLREEYFQKDMSNMYLLEECKTLSSVQFFLGKEDFGPTKPWEEQRTVASWRFCPCHTLSVFICQMDLETDIELKGGCFSRSNSHPDSCIFITWRIIPEGLF